MLASKEFAKFDNQIDFLYSSSAALPGGDKEKLSEILPHVRKFDAYGGSEVGAVCYIDYNSVNRGLGCVGKANPGVDIFIVDEDYKPFKATKDCPGIIAIRSNTVTAGYWDEPELTAATIHDGVIYMSDLGYIDEEGYLFLAGRRDDVINIGGLKIAPTEVEDAALRFSPIAECACTSFEHSSIGRCLKMFVVLKDGFMFDEEEMTKFLETKLEAYKIPKIYEVISEIPKTFNGKIDRKKLM
jgi:acyl-CoA synthetase (AMP-forming)/AMP-acid ligase II